MVINTRHCRACWKGLEDCPAQTLGKINLPFYKHIKEEQAEKCKGCLKCVKACPCQAIMPVKKEHLIHEAA